MSEDEKFLVINKDLIAIQEWSEEVGEFVANILRYLTCSMIFPPASERTKIESLKPIKASEYLKYIDNKELDLQSAIGLKIDWLFPKMTYSRSLTKRSSGGLSVTIIDVQEGSEERVIEERLCGGKMISGNVVLRDIVHGHFIDFVTMTPPCTFFLPARFTGLQEEDIDKSALLLRSYRGQSLDGLEEVSGYRARSLLLDDLAVSYVEYESISKSGGVFSLLHEIAHVWQFYQNDLSSSLFIRDALSYVQLIVDSIIEDESEEKISANKRAVSCIEMKYDVVLWGLFHKPNVVEVINSIEEDYKDHIFINVCGMTALFLSRKENFFDYVLSMRRWQERNAWFSAIYIVRYFRRKLEFDIESSMNNWDLISHAHRCLETYDNDVAVLLEYDSRTMYYSR